MLIVATFGNYYKTSNFRNHQQVSKGWMEKSNEVPVHPVKRYGSSIQKSAFRKYYMEKLANGHVQNNDSRAQLIRWFRHFNPILVKLPC